MRTFPPGDLAIVIGASGGIGGALATALEGSGAFARTLRVGRTSPPALDLRDENSIAACAKHVATLGVPRLIVNATGMLHSETVQPEKSWRELDAGQMAEAFAVNAIGPALVMKHFLPLLPREGKSVFATLSARVGSIGDNRLGGWYSYRASKAALNQLVRTAAVELHRRHSEPVCVALHPGTVDTRLSSPFSKDGLEVQPPAVAAERLLEVIDRLGPGDSGGFFNTRGHRLPW
jgi:NAD(P)-dependent dehydrogenase (short-subunit alcohol dehydrogenase family)